MGWRDDDGVSDWSLDKIPEITGADAAFPARALEWLPDWKSMEETKQEALGWKHNEWGKYINKLFFHGGYWPTAEDMKEDVDIEDAAKALKIVSAALGSFSPSHEHKVSACGWILAQYFKEPPVRKDQKEIE